MATRTVAGKANPPVRDFAAELSFLTRALKAPTLREAVQRLAERAGRARASRFAMLGEPISGVEAGTLGIATHVAADDELAKTADTLIGQLATGPTRSYAATRTLLKAWSSGGVAAADLVMLDVAMELYDGEDAQRGFASTAKAFDADVEPPAMVFQGK